MRCSECQKVYSMERNRRTAKIWRLENPEKQNKTRREYEAKNREKINDAMKNWRVVNSETFKEYRKIYYLNNSEKIKRDVKERRAKDPEKYREQARRRRLENPEPGRVSARKSAHKRRALKLDKLGVVSSNIMEILMKRQNSLCIGCNRKFSEEIKPTLDHIVALNSGGLHDDSNLQILCRSCNSSKQDKSMTEWKGNNTLPPQQKMYFVV